MASGGRRNISRRRRARHKRPRPAARHVSLERIEALYKELSGLLMRYASWRHGLSREDSGDMVQQVFVIALEKMESEKNAKTWLIRVLDGLAANQHRTAARRSALLERWGERDRCSETEENIASEET